jgi:hypothetical protein
LNKAANQALEDPRVIKAFSNPGADIPQAAKRTPEALGKFVSTEITLRPEQRNIWRLAFRDASPRFSL